MDLLSAGQEYLKFPNAYVIFICDFDPFGYGKYRYTFRSQCMEVPGVTINDGSETIFLNTRGTNPESISTELVNFLKYVRADLNESMEDFGDDFIKNLQKSVHEIKQSRRMGERYMLTELLMQDERRAGRIEENKESILEFLSELGPVSETIQKTITQESDLVKLRTWTKLAARVTSIAQFETEM